LPLIAVDFFRISAGKAAALFGGVVDDGFLRPALRPVT
jgi:hypothetical protein